MMATQPINKAGRIEAYVKAFGLDAEGFDPCYLAYFVCFNTQEYYEAHDVLEHLWLQREDENHAFFKGLIQFAGAFVHLKKQSIRPWHPTDGRRMRPAVRLFALARKNLTPYAPQHMGLDVCKVLGLATEHVSRIETSGFSKNPWHPDTAPKLELHIARGDKGPGTRP
jgi:predicted metal-dependent hydrolase